VIAVVVCGQCGDTSAAQACAPAARPASRS
jgi:hypothetical protein